jgi:TRAP-type transport system periplasmic protein
VRSFQAMTAPLLIDSYPLQLAVFDSGLPGRMLPAVADLSIVGLAVLAGGLRKPVAADRPLLEPADWRGVTFQTMRSHIQADAVR